MKKNYFVEAYLKNKNLEAFWSNYSIKSKTHIPYISKGKINFKKNSFQPICDLKRHIFIK